MLEDHFKPNRCGLLATTALLIGGAVIFLGSQPASAQDSGPTQVGEICMQRVFGTPVANSNLLNCTANDIRISGVAEDAQGNPLVNPTSCISGTSFTLEATFEIDVTANARYDSAFFFRLDGGENARGDGSGATGTCSLSALDPSTAPAEDLDGDTCGDLNAGVQQVTFTIPNVQCVGVPDPDNPDQLILKLPNCTSWHNNQGTACSIGDPFDFDPDTKSKCVCDDEFTVPVVVETAEITVVKTAAPTMVDELGGTVTYTVQVTNDATIESVTLDFADDSIYGDLLDDQNPNITNNTCLSLDGFELAAGASTNCTFDAFVQGNANDVITDVVEVCGDQSGPVSTPEVCDDDDADVTITDIQTDPQLTKTALSAGCTVDVNYQVVINNNSEVDDLTVDSLTDVPYGDITTVQGDVVSTDCATGAVIAPGGNYNCNFTGRIDDEDCGIDLSDTVTGGMTDDDGISYTKMDSATVNVNTTFP